MKSEPTVAAQKARKRVNIDINANRCKGCGFCAEFCPLGILKMSDKRGPKGYATVNIVDSDKCRGCGICQAMCPDFAIKLSETPAEEEREPGTHGK